MAIVFWIHLEAGCVGALRCRPEDAQVLQKKKSQILIVEQSVYMSHF